jgi:hypothetical protein
MVLLILAVLVVAERQEAFFSLMARRQHKEIQTAQQDLVLLVVTVLLAELAGIKQVRAVAEQVVLAVIHYLHPQYQVAMAVLEVLEGNHQ